MTWYPRALVLIGSASLLAACGGRSQLHDVGASSAGGGGSGGTTSSSATTASSNSTASASSGGGNGGGGGAPPDGCVIDGPPIGIAGTEGYAVQNPVLLAPGKSDLTTLVAGWTTTEGPMTPPSEVRHTSFHAWGAWPANGTIAPSYLANYDGGQSFVAAPAATGFSVFLALPSSEIDFMTPFTPGSGAAAGMGSALPLAAEPTFLAQGKDPDIHLLGFSSSKQGIHDLSIVRLSDTMGGEKISPALGCAIDPIVAAAAPVGEEFLVAFSGGGAFGGPDCSTTAAELFIGRVTKQGTFEGVQQIEPAFPSSTIKSVKLVPRVDGAWLAWTDTMSGLHVARLDPTGKLAAAPTEMPFVGDLDTLSATSLGDRLALAWSVTPADSPLRIRVNVISTAGNVDANVAIDLGHQATGRTAILGSPSNTSLLLGWAEEVSPGPQMRLARLACSLP